MKAVLATTAAALVLALGALDAHAQGAGGGTTWLCRPGLTDNPCEVSRLATVVEPDGAKRNQRAPAERRRPVDCFYVYPTVSNQPGPNADLTIDPQERGVAILQASRFSQVCRVFAPMYPQITLAGLAHIDAQSAATAYLGVQSAFQDYMQNYNRGRGVVLIGHSQGTAMLTALMRNQVDQQPAVRSKLVSALLMGGSVVVPAGKNVGGTFQQIPACRAPRQTGCVVSYASFGSQPPADSVFGRVGQGLNPFANVPATGPQQVMCVNPASPHGGAGALDPYFRASDPRGAGWVTYPDMYRAHCASSGGATWLQVDRLHRRGDRRPGVQSRLPASWGLHTFDVNLALGNLVSLVREQGAAYAR